MSRQGYGSINDAVPLDNLGANQLILVAAAEKAAQTTVDVAQSNSKKSCSDHCERSTKMSLCCCLLTTAICATGGMLALHTPWGALTGSCGPIMGAGCKYCSTIFDEDKKQSSSENEAGAQPAPKSQSMK